MRKFNKPRGKAHRTLFLYDAIFILLAALYAWLAFKGIAILSANGTVLDSDLQTYAQGMAGAAFPEQFINDPVLAQVSEANSIPNLQRWLASHFVEHNNFGLALLKAGACAIFLFYACWYGLGRYLFTRPAIASLLAICSSITVWVGWGTFWGVAHSDPVPRVFFAAIFPLLLFFACLAFRKSCFRPATMFCCGLSMWIHGVSALNCGAMFLCAFLFCKQKNQSLKKHLGIFGLCLICFLLPVCLYLWPSLNQGKSFAADDLAMFQEMQNLRWHEDFSGFWPRMLDFFRPSSPTFILSLCGLASWLILIRNENQRFYPLLKMIPYFILALLAVACFAWLESGWARELGRLSMGHELVRGMRFFIPLSWLLIIAAIAAYTTKWLGRAMLLCALCLVVLLNQDRQHLAVESAAAHFMKLPLPEDAAIEIKKAQIQQDIIAEVGRIVPENETVFCPEDQMPVRFMAMRPLTHAFKDGYVFFYDKDLLKSRNWLNIEKVLRSEGIIQAWKVSGANWLLARKASLDQNMAQKAAFDLHNWLLIRQTEKQELN